MTKTSEFSFNQPFNWPDIWPSLKCIKYKETRNIQTQKEFTEIKNKVLNLKQACPNYHINTTTGAYCLLLFQIIHGFLWEWGLVIVRPKYLSVQSCMSNKSQRFGPMHWNIRVSVLCSAWRWSTKGNIRLSQFSFTITFAQVYNLTVYNQALLLDETIFWPWKL